MPLPGGVTDRGEIQSFPTGQGKYTKIRSNIQCQNQSISNILFQKIN